MLLSVLSAYENLGHITRPKNEKLRQSIGTFLIAISITLLSLLGKGFRVH